MTAAIDRDKWLAERRKGLGGSDIAAMLGLSKYKTPYQLWLDKTGRETQDAQNEAAYWGNTLEEVIAKEYAKRNGVKIQRVNQVLVGDQPYMLGNIDRAVVNPAISGNVRYKEGFGLTTDRILEVKTSSGWLEKLWGDDDEAIPDYYLSQTQWYMGNLGEHIHTCDLAVLIGGQKYRQYRIGRDDELIAILKDEAVKFWNEYVLADTPPDPTTIGDCLHRWSTHTDGKVIDADPDLLALIIEYREMKQAMKSGETEIDRLYLEIIKKIEDAECVVMDAGKKLMSFKGQANNRFDTTAFRAAHPDLAEQFTKSSTSRVLRLSKF